MLHPITSDASGQASHGRRPVARAHAAVAMTAAWSGSHSTRERAGANTAGGSAGRSSIVEALSLPQPGTRVKVRSPCRLARCSRPRSAPRS
jgi:hypothetical protein